MAAGLKTSLASHATRLPASRRRRAGRAAGGDPAALAAAVLAAAAAKPAAGWGATRRWRARALGCARRSQADEVCAGLRALRAARVTVPRAVELRRCIGTHDGVACFNLRGRRTRLLGSDIAPVHKEKAAIVSHMTSGYIFKLDHKYGENTLTKGPKQALCGNNEGS